MRIIKISYQEMMAWARGCMAMAPVMPWGYVTGVYAGGATVFFLSGLVLIDSSIQLSHANPVG